MTISSSLPLKWSEMTPLLMPARTAMAASEALAYPTSAITSTAAATIWARRAFSMNVWPFGSFSGRTVRK